MAEQPQLVRRLGLTSAISITVGSVIGSGIFLKPLAVASSIPNDWAIYFAWALLGLVCLCGAFAYGELGAAYPGAGGLYTFLERAFGRQTAFLFGWCYFLVVNTGAVAALAAAFAAAVSRITPLTPNEQILVGCAMIFALAFVNHFGVRFGALLQNSTTAVKLGSLGLIFFGGLIFVLTRDPAGAGEAANAAAAVGPPARTPDQAAAMIALPLTSTGFASAAIAIFWAYEGWHQMPFSAGELKRPERDVPLGLILGVLLLVSLYVAINAIYLSVVPLQEMLTLGEDLQVPTLVVSRILGDVGPTVLAIMIAISVFGAANPNILSSSRPLWKMANEGLAPKFLTHVHSHWNTPVASIWIQAGWAMALLLVLKEFHDLTEFVVFVALVFYALGVAAVYVLRQKEPDHPRPYRCFGYPVAPALFLIVVVFVEIHMLLDTEKRINALIGLGILALGWPVYAWLERHPTTTDEGE